MHQICLTEYKSYWNIMEGDQGTGAPSDEPQADSAAASDSFSQLWTDVMGMLVSFSFLGGGGMPGRLQADITGSHN